MATIVTSAGNVTTKPTQGGYFLIGDDGECIGTWTPSNGPVMRDEFSKEEIANLDRVLRMLWSPEPKTIRVRIAVAVNEQGRWYAYGVSGEDDEALKAGAEQGLDTDYAYAIHFIEATIPLPESVVVEGEVT